MSGISRASVAALLALALGSGAARSSAQHASGAPRREQATLPAMARTPLMTGCLLGGIAPKGRGHAGGTLSIAHGERTAAMADTDNDRVAIVDLSPGQIALDHTIAVGRAPAQVVLGSDGRVFVTERQSNTLSVYEASSGRLLCRATTPADPVGIALSPDEKTVLVTSGIAHALSAFDTETFAPRWSIDVPREPRGVATSRDGRVVYVAHLAGAPMSRIDVNNDSPRLHAMPALPIPAEHRVVAVTMPTHMWRERWFEEELFKPEGDRPDDTGLIAHSLGPVTTHAAASNVVAPPAGSVAIARSFGPIAPPTRPAPPHVASVATHAAEPHDDRIHPVPSQAWTVAIGEDDEPYVAFMVNRTGNEVPMEQRRDAYGAGSASPEADGEKLSFALGRYDSTADRWVAVTLPERLRSRAHAGHIRIPSALAIDPRTGRLVVAAMGTQRIAHISPDGRLLDDPGDTLRAPCGVAVLHDGREVVFSQLAHSLEVRNGHERSEVSIGDDALAADVAHGRALFYSADDTRISSGGLSCGGCHPEGRDDGLVWFLAHGPRQTPTLAGRLEHPFNWNGTANELSSNIVQTIHRLGGTGVKPGEVEALTAFLTHGLQAPRVDAPVLTAQQIRGHEVFENEGACAACHDAGRNYTDGLSHALGGLRRDETRREFDTPSLRFLDSTAPYFHDGRFATVHDMLLDGRHHMGHADHLAPGDLAALESYLHTL